jgi:hypothetical protein
MRTSEALSSENFHSFPKADESTRKRTVERMERCLEDPDFCPPFRTVKSLQMFLRADWSSFCLSPDRARGRIYDFWTQEYVERLTVRLAERVNAVVGDFPIFPIVEFGAGNGVLSHLLNREFARNGQSLRVVPVDDSSWYHHGVVTDFLPVRHADGYRFITETRPVIVLSSWTDPTIANDQERNLHAFLKNAPSVREYVMIGPPESCGNDDLYPEWLEKDGIGIRPMEDLGAYQVAATSTWHPNGIGERGEKSKTLLYSKRN